MNKKSLSERDICTKFITPSLVAAGWDLDTQIREEVGFTDGRIYVRGKIHARGAKKRDYFSKYGNFSRKVIAASLDKYADTGSFDLESRAILTMTPINQLGTPKEITDAFGGPQAYDDAIHLLNHELYKVA